MDNAAADFNCSNQKPELRTGLQLWVGLPLVLLAALRLAFLEFRCFALARREGVRPLAVRAALPAHSAAERRRRAQQRDDVRAELRERELDRRGVLGF